MADISEQGPILEGTGRKIGVVSGGQAYKWFQITVHGRDSHAGTTPLAARSDPILFASHFIARSNEIAHEYNGLATTGILSLEPGSINTIPNTVTFTLDIRHHSDVALGEMEQALRAALSEMQAGTGVSVSARECRVDVQETFHSPAVHFDERCVGLVRAAAEEVVGADKVMGVVSGAGHDTCSTSKRCPSAMVFVPSRDGLSHNPREYTTDEDW